MGTLMQAASSPKSSPKERTLMHHHQFVSCYSGIAAFNENGVGACCKLGNIYFLKAAVYR